MAAATVPLARKRPLAIVNNRNVAPAAAALFVSGAARNA